MGMCTKSNAPLISIKTALRNLLLQKVRTINRVYKGWHTLHNNNSTSESEKIVLEAMSFLSMNQSRWVLIVYLTILQRPDDETIGLRLTVEVLSLGIGITWYCFQESLESCHKLRYHWGYLKASSRFVENILKGDDRNAFKARCYWGTGRNSRSKFFETE